MKKDNGKELTFQKMMDLYPGMSIWLVDIERCREQDKNAQVMPKSMFDRLKKNIEDDKRLESLPLGYIAENAAGNKEFHIISGHHRLRAARMGNVKEVYVLVIEEQLTEDQIKSKQLAHNALTGHSDPQVLKEIYESIKNIDEKIKAGVNEVELDKEKFRSVSLDNIQFDFDFKVMKFMFLSSQKKNFEDTIAELQKEDNLYIANMEEFEKFTTTIRELSKVDNVRNIASIIDRMCEITKKYIADKKLEIKQDKSKEKAQVKPNGKMTPNVKAEA